MNHRSSRACLRFIMTCRVLAVLLTLAFLGGGRSFAKPADRAQALRVAQGWLNSSPSPMGAKMATTVSKITPYRDDNGTTLCHVASLSSGGYVVVAGDDAVEPIVAFSSKGSFSPGGKDPLSALLRNDMRVRLSQLGSGASSTIPTQEANVKWSRLAARPSASARPTASDNGISSISDVRVAAMLQSQWYQDTVTDYSGATLACYNYYTPPFSSGSTSNFSDGCVATATAQLLRFYQYPTTGVGTGSFTISVYTPGGDYASQTASLRGGNGSGGAYAWSSMPLVPEGASLSTTQLQAIGDLCYDTGVSAYMEYSPYGSGAYVNDQRDSLVNTFKYANAIYAGVSYVLSGNSGYYVSTVPANLSLMILPSLDAGYPTILGIYDTTNGGHDIVCDGYGYNSTTLYYHLNMGWAGEGDAWYNLPPIVSNGYDFTIISDCVYNIYVTGSGEIVSGRVLDPNGNPISGATVTATPTAGGGSYSATTNANGIYALAKIPSSKTYQVGVSASGYAFASKMTTTGASNNATVNEDTGTVTGGSTGNVWGLNFTAALDLGTLNVTPTTTQTSAGLVGGPYSPTSFSYTVTDGSSGALNWNVSADQNWITLATTGGTGLTTTSSATVNAQLNSGVNALAAGTHVATLTFTNANNGSNVVTRAISVTATAIGTLSVTPTTTQTSTGLVGGPSYSPTGFAYTVKNGSPGVLNWNVSTDQSWITLGTTGGTGLTTTSSATVNAQLNSGVNALAAGTHVATLTFSNANNGSDVITRAISVTTTAIGTLSVTPTTTQASGGLAGGPYSPTSFAYTVKNGTAGVLNWNVSANHTWITLTTTGGTGLTTTSSATVIAQLNSGVNSLGIGSRDVTLTFTNVNNGSDVITRAITLTTYAIGSLSVTPTNEQDAKGAVGGPYSPLSFAYTIENGTQGMLNWSVSADQSWITLSATGGTGLLTSSSATVYALLNSNALALPNGTSTATLTFVNANDGSDALTRAIVVSTYNGVLKSWREYP
jgi:hypothetical protein